jgi:WD40 repeat protein
VFSPDGRVLAVAEEADIGGLSLYFALGKPTAPGKKGRAVRLLDAPTSEERTQLEARWWSSIDAPVFSPDGRFVAASGSYLPYRGLALNELKVWSAGTGREEATLRGYSAPLFSPDGKTLAAVNGGAMYGGPVTLWDVPLPTRAWRLAGMSALWVLVTLVVCRRYMARWQKRAGPAQRTPPGPPGPDVRNER